MLVPRRILALLTRVFSNLQQHPSMALSLLPVLNEGAKGAASPFLQTDAIGFFLDILRHKKILVRCIAIGLKK